MKKLVLLPALLTILCNVTFSQVVFESGYFINESNQRIECLIKNIDWKNNPTDFEYKLAQDTIIHKATIQSIKEFGIYNVSKYIRASVDIDKSSDVLSNLGTDRNPSFQKEQLFLKVLIEGDASLYLYEHGNLTRFFFNTNNDTLIKQLVYKRFLLKSNIAQNNTFRQQLFLALKCQTLAQQDVEYIKYNIRDLERIFIRYNECADYSYIIYGSEKKKDLFNLTVRPGLNFSNLEIQNSGSEFKDVVFDNKNSFRIGIEAEFIFPFNKNKWSTIIEPTYQYFKSEREIEVKSITGGVYVADVNYKSIELPIGLRYYLYLNNKSKIFINTSYIFDFGNNSTIDFKRTDGSVVNSLEIKSRSNLALGTGFKYKDKYSFEIRYQTSREILDNYVYWKSNYKTFSIVFGYSFF